MPELQQRLFMKKHSLPKHVANTEFCFGIGSLPSDNINKIMNNTFEKEHIQKLKEKAKDKEEKEKFKSQKLKNRFINQYYNHQNRIQHAMTMNPSENRLLPPVKSENHLKFDQI